MANLRKIRELIDDPIFRNGDKGQVVGDKVYKLVEFYPPICIVCKAELKNVNTVEGKRRYQCMTWNCTNKRMYDQEGNQIGPHSTNPKEAA